MNASVLFDTQAAANGMRIGVATLNAPQTLNGLDLEMVQRLYEQLQLWADDAEVAVVMLKGEGGKAFCAGGDLHGLYRSMQQNASDDAWNNDYARRFFESEYRLDHFIHHYPKPVLCWGHGIVMGGGIGLMMGASHRVVTETSRLAMPEITIGLFPDVGGSWLLNRMPGKTGLFLALTGAQIGGSDALFTGLADFMVASSSLPDIMASLLEQPWAGHAAGRASGDETPGASGRSINDGLLRHVLNAHAAPPPSPGPLRQNAFQINSLCSGNDLDQIVEDLRDLAGHQDAWLARAATTLAHGAPGSARLAFTLQQRTRLMSLADVFRTEYIAALACTVHGDLKEGIRALLIDKDKRPRWHPATLADADAEWVQRFFRAPWPEGQTHPLADLGGVA